MAQGGYHLLPEYILVKDHGGRVVAGVEGDFALPAHLPVKDQGDASLPFKPQPQRT